MTSLLDPGQIIKQVYDEPNNAVRVELTAGVTIGAITIKDSTTGNEAHVNTEGELFVALGDATTGDTASVSAAGAVKVDGSAVTQPVSITSVPLAANAATASNQALEITQLDAINTNTTGISTATNQVTGNGSLATIASTVSTAANQATAQTSLDSIVTNTAASATSANQVTAQTSLTTIASSISGTNTPIPSNAILIGGNNSSGNLWPVSVDSSGNVNVNVISDAPAAGKIAVDFVRLDYTASAVTTAAYTQLIASTPDPATELFLFDSSGQTLVLAFGASGSESDQMLIVPGGNGTQSLSIPTGTRISIKAISATANVGEIDLNLFG